jgi:hypothetical protein
MVSERKYKKYDIEKLHQLIDSASLPKQKKNSSYNEEKLTSLRKRLSDEPPVKTKKKASSSERVHAKSEGLKPRVVVHKREEIQKKEEKVIRIELGQRKEKKQKESDRISVFPSTEDLFITEALYEVERIATGGEFQQVQSIDAPEKTAHLQEFTPVVSVRNQTDNHLPEWQLVEDTRPLKPQEKPKTDNDIELQRINIKKESTSDDTPVSDNIPEFKPVDEKEISLPPRFSEDEQKIPSFEQVEFEMARAEKPLEERREGRKKEKEEKKQKKLEEKRTRHEPKEKERKKFHLFKEHEGKLRLGRGKSRKTEEKSVPLKTPSKEAVHSQQAEIHEIPLPSQKETQPPLSKWEPLEEEIHEEVSQIPAELKEPSAPETIDLSSKEKEQEQKRLKKELKEKQRLEKIEQKKKEKEEKRQKKLEEKQAFQEMKEKEREAKRLTKEHDEKLRAERSEVQKKQKEEQRAKDEEKKKAAVEAKEKDREERRILKEREEKLKIEKLKLKEKEKEEQKLQKLETKKTAVAAPVVQKKSLFAKKPNEDVAHTKQEEIHEIPLPSQKETQPPLSKWEPLEEEMQEWASKTSTELKEPPVGDTIDLSSKEKKQEQKRLKKEQKEKQRLEKIEQKKKEKEEKRQKKLEERQPVTQFSGEKTDKKELKRKKLEAKQARREAKEKQLQTEKQTKEQRKQQQFMLALKEHESRMTEKEEQKQKKYKEKLEKERLSTLVLGKGTEKNVDEEQKKAEKQEIEKKAERNELKEAEKAAIKDAKKQRKLKAFKRKMQKEEEKKEKEAQKAKANEEAKANKKMDLYFEEKVIKEKLSSIEERIDVFNGFDSIDQKTANLLYKNGITSIEKLKEATIKDLLKIGIKKKLGLLILAESEDFIEWEVIDADKQSEGKI